MARLGMTALTDAILVSGLEPAYQLTPDVLASARSALSSLRPR
jgi:hypothetical protein